MTKMIQDLFKKYSKQLDDFWHTRMNPINLMLRLKKGEFGNPISILAKPLVNDKVNEFIKENLNKDDDEKAFLAHLFIKMTLRIKYKPDSEVWNDVDYWQSPQLTTDIGTGDCEDQTLLWLKLMQLLEVPSYKCMAIGGYVNNDTLIEGHCYPLYFTGIRAVNMDVTYYVRILKIKDRATFKIPSDRYLSLWWAFNWRSCYKYPYWVKP